MLDRPVRSIRYLWDVNSYARILSRRLRIWGPVVGLTAGLFEVLVIFRATAWEAFFYLLPATIGSILIFLFLPYLYKLLLTTTRNRWMFEVHQVVEFTDKFITNQYDNGYSTKAPWDMVFKVVVNRQFLLVYTTGYPTVIPRSAIPDPEDEKRLLEFCQSRNLISKVVPPRIS